MAICIVIGGLIAYYAYVDGVIVNEPVAGLSDTLRTTRMTYAPGETVDCELSFSNRRCVTTTVQWHLVDTYLIAYEPKTMTLCQGMYSFITPIGPIPVTAPVGRYYFRGSFAYRVNPWRVVTKYVVTNTFDVKDD
jgi:hypothetical protein